MENRQQMIQLMQEKENLAAELFEKKMNTIAFPESKIPAGWRDYVSRALEIVKPFTVKCSLKDFTNLIDDKLFTDGSKIYYFQFGVLTNSLEAASIAELGTTRSEYKEFLLKLVPVMEWYNEQIALFRKNAKLEADETIKLKATALSQNGGLSAVKAEA